MHTKYTFDKKVNRIARCDVHKKPDSFVNHRRVLIAIRHAPAMSDKLFGTEGPGVFTIGLEQCQRDGKRRFARLAKQVADILVCVKSTDTNAALPANTHQIGNLRIRIAKHHKFKSVAMERIIMFCEQFEIEPVAPSDKRTGR